MAGVGARKASEEAQRVSALTVLFLGPYAFSSLVSSALWRVFERGNLPPRIFPCGLDISLLRQESPEKVRKEYGVGLSTHSLTWGESGKTSTHIPHPLA